MNKFSDIEDALKEFEQGKCIIVVDDESRENEGDIIFSAATATQEKINFCASKAKGLICISMQRKTAQQIGIAPLASNKKDNFQTAFYTPIDAAHEHGITTGISAKERAITAKLTTNPNAKSSDFITPGHLFPVIAKPNGVLTRPGHTEAAVDLCKLTHQTPVAIICEIMNDNGDMMRRNELFEFAEKENLKIISIQQIIEYRRQHNIQFTEENEIEQYLQKISSAQLPTEFGAFNAIAFKNIKTFDEHLVLETHVNPNVKPIVRFHSECLTGDVFHSQKCDCQSQLQHTLELISKNGNGALIYVKGHEGRGIGIANKIAAYHLQEQGMDTFNANTALGLPEDARNYDDAIEILKQLEYTNFHFVTNNPLKINAIKNAGFTFEIMQVKSTVTSFNEQYLNTKKTIAKHQLIH